MSHRILAVSNSLLALCLAACPRAGGVPEGDDSKDTAGTDDTVKDTSAVDTDDTDDTTLDTSHTDSGDDTGEVKPAWLWPDYMYANMVLGVNDGQIGNFAHDEGESNSYLTVVLMDERYLDAENEIYLCALYWLITGENTSPDGTLPTWDLYYEPYWESDGCYNLDPDVYGWDPIDEVGISRGDLSIEATTDATIEATTEMYGKDYFSQEPYFAAEASLDSLDGEMDYYRQWWPDMQLYYGLAYTADENMYSTFNEYLPTESALAGDHGVYYVVSHYMPAPTGW